MRGFRLATTGTKEKFAHLKEQSVLEKIIWERWWKRSRRFTILHDLER